MRGSISDITSLSPRLEVANAAVDPAPPPVSAITSRDIGSCILGMREGRPSGPADARFYEGARRVAEFAATVVLFVATLPLVVVAGLAVRVMSAGPAIYTQRRVGRGGREFTIYKLRTMGHKCEAASGVRWASRRDPRVTPVGRLLRASHLDELPQLWNVLRGEMSLIGPRPERPEIVAVLRDQIPGYGDRLAVTPGVTGLAQIQLPPDTSVASVARKLDLDRAYITNRGAWLDVHILLGTLLHLACVPHPRIRRLLRLPAGGGAA